MPLSYVSPDQVNAFIPFDTPIPANTVVPLVLKNSVGSTTYNIRLLRNAPGIFTLNGAGTGPAILLTSDQRAVTTVGPQDSIVFYATGLGPVDGLGHPSDNLVVYLGEQWTPVQSVATIPSLPGIYQVQVNAGVLATDRLYLLSSGWQSNIVDVPIRPGSNAANVSGTIDGLYPSSNAFFTLPFCTSDDGTGPPCSSGQDLSVMLHAGSFNVAFDILPTSTFFYVAAVGEAGSALILINPASGKYSATINVPDSGPERIGNFQPYNISLWDYSSCASVSAVCSLLPGGIVPPSRLSPFWLQATQSLPVPTDIPDKGNDLNWIFQSTGSVTGSHFTIDAQNNTNLSKFGGFKQVPYGPFDKRTSTFKLYVDGRLIATKDLPYTVTHR